VLIRKPTGVHYRLVQRDTGENRKPAYSPQVMRRDPASMPQNTARKLQLGNLESPKNKIPKPGALEGYLMKRKPDSEGNETIMQRNKDTRGEYPG